MKKDKIIILGSGSSVGVPRIDGYWGRADKNNIKNNRTRCSIYIKYRSSNILIDTSPDIRNQLLKNKITKIDNVIYTHDHADQTHGINELRPFFWKNKKKINVYTNRDTAKTLYKSFTYLFIRKSKFYNPILKMNIINKKFFISKNQNKILFEPIIVTHGDTKAYGYIFKKIAYISDCSFISNKELKKLQNLNILIIDCLKFKKHKTHLNYYEAIKYIKILNPKKTILTNLHSDIDYKKLKNMLAKLTNNIVPAYDGMKIKYE
jgi:phosphoribosyl 1,2-cyclic phosphate phosphodiesterase